MIPTRSTCRVAGALLVALVRAQLLAATFTAPPDQVNLRIPPVGTGGSGDTNQDITRSTIVVSGFNTNQPISYFKLNLSLNHTYDGDLVITLVTPEGTPIILANRLGGSGSNYVNTTFDDEAGRSISSGQPPFSGYFTPVNSFGFGFFFQSNNVPNQIPNGTWTLLVEDRAAGNTGTLVTWSLAFVLQPVVDTDYRKILWNTPGFGEISGPHDVTSDTFLEPRLGFSFYGSGVDLLAVTNATGGAKALSETVPAANFYAPAAAVLPDGMGGHSEWVFVTAVDGRLYKLNPQDGTIAASVDLIRLSCANGPSPDESPIAPVIQMWSLSDLGFRTAFADGDSLVFAGTHDGCGDTSNNRILAFRASNLQQVWSFNGDGSYNINAITGMTLDYARDTLYAVTVSAAGQQTVLALATIASNSVAPKWSFNAGTVYVKPVLGDGCIYVAGYDGVLHKLNAETGAEIWSLQMAATNGLNSGPYSRYDPAFDPIRNMLFVTDSEYLVAVKDQGDVATLAWNRYTVQTNFAQSGCPEVLPPTSFALRPVVVPDLGKLYINDVDHIYQYDIASRTIEADANVDGTNNNSIYPQELILDSDDGGATLHRLMVIGQNYFSADTQARFSIPWYFRACFTVLGNAPTNDLAIAVSSIWPPFYQGAALVGQPLTYTLAVTNLGPGDVGGVTVGDLLPPGLAFVSASVSQGRYSCEGNVFAAELGTLTNGAASMVSLTVLPTMGGPVAHAATVAADSNYDPVPANNTVDLSFITSAILAISNSSVVEPAFGTIPMVFTVALSGPHYQPVSVDYVTSDLTAQAGLDYVSTSGTLIFNPGETNKTLSVQVMSDTTISGDETFQVLLSNPTNAVLLYSAVSYPYAAIGTIIDDDGPILLHISLAGGKALLSWSTNIEGFTLETRTNLNSGARNQVFSPVGVVGDQNVVTNDIPFSTQFYRLVKYNGPPQ